MVHIGVFGLAHEARKQLPRRYWYQNDPWGRVSELALFFWGPGSVDPSDICNFEI